MQAYKGCNISVKIPHKASGIIYTPPYLLARSKYVSQTAMYLHPCITD